MPVIPEHHRSIGKPIGPCIVTPYKRVELYTTMLGGKEFFIVIVNDVARFISRNKKDAEYVAETEGV